MGRRVPAKIIKFLNSKFGNRCAFPGCRKPWCELHHTKRFSLTKRHFPDEIVPLCKIHHELAHAGLIKNEHLQIGLWDLDLYERKNEEIAWVDGIVIDHKRRHMPWKTGKSVGGQP